MLIKINIDGIASAAMSLMNSSDSLLLPEKINNTIGPDAIAKNTIR